MENMKELSDEELEQVVGGSGDSNDIYDAFSNFMCELKNVYDELNNASQMDMIQMNALVRGQNNYSNQTDSMLSSLLADPSDGLAGEIDSLSSGINSCNAQIDAVEKMLAICSRILALGTPTAADAVRAVNQLDQYAAIAGVLADMAVLRNSLSGYFDGIIQGAL